MLEILLELILDIFWTREPGFNHTARYVCLDCLVFFRSKIAIHHTVCYCSVKGLSKRAFWQEEECYDVGSGPENLLLEKQSQMHNNDFNMKYDITIMLFCLETFTFEACIFYLWCASVI